MQKTLTAVSLWVGFSMWNPIAAQEDLIGGLAKPEFKRDVFEKGLNWGGPKEVAEKTKLMIVNQIVRGMIQNELNVVSRICSLTDDQKQSFVDLVEREWSSRSQASVTKSIQRNVLGAIDLDALSERLTQGWLKQVAKPEQCAAYDAELSDRMEYRKTAVISSALDVLQQKLELSGRQVGQVEEVLVSQWRDRWYRSYESTFFNPTLMPELRIRSFENIITKAQESAFLVREGQTVFGGMTSSDECPFLEVSSRFSLGKIVSSETIKLALVDGEKSANTLLDEDEDKQGSPASNGPAKAEERR